MLNANDTVSATVSGLETGQTNLTPGSNYYTSTTNGIISTTNSGGSVLVGKAITNNILKIT